jgi:hypothetical protein
MMAWKSILAAAALVAVAGFANSAFAGADDYVFEPVNAEIKSSNVAVVAVRLVHKPSGKPVPDAAIVQTRIDMAPDGNGLDGRGDRAPAKSAARDLCVQGAAHHGGTLALDCFRPGAGRARDGVEKTAGF